MRVTATRTCRWCQFDQFPRHLRVPVENPRRAGIVMSIALASSAEQAKKSLGCTSNFSAVGTGVTSTKREYNIFFTYIGFVQPNIYIYYNDYNVIESEHSRLG